VFGVLVVLFFCDNFFYVLLVLVSAIATGNSRPLLTAAIKFSVVKKWGVFVNAWDKSSVMVWKDIEKIIKRL
jgi:hypothetical protein